jgi:hypothetical protein
MRRLVFSREPIGAMAETPPKSAKKITAEEYTRICDDFYQQYGRTLAAWSHVEMMLFSFFRTITNMSEPMARGIFYSARSYQGRSDMLDSLVIGLKDARQKFLKAALKKAATYNGFRNTIVHGEPIYDARGKSKFYGQMVISQGKLVEIDNSSNVVTVEQLRNATENYGKFAGILLKAVSRETFS